MYKGAANMLGAPVCSPNSSRLVPPAKLPKEAFSNYLQFPWVPATKLPTKLIKDYLKFTFQITFNKTPRCLSKSPF